MFLCTWILISSRGVIKILVHFCVAPRTLFARLASPLVSHFVVAIPRNLCVAKKCAVHARYTVKFSLLFVSVLRMKYRVNVALCFPKVSRCEIVATSLRRDKFCSVSL